MYCTHCGREIRDGQQFCPGCGTPASLGSLPPEEPPRPAPAPAPAPAPQQKRRGLSAGAIVGIVLGAVLTVAAVAGGVLFFLGHGTRTASTPAEDLPVTDNDQPVHTPAEPGGTPAPAVPLERRPLSLLIRQIDNSAFPDVTFYSSVYDDLGQTVSGLTASDFVLREFINGTPQEQTLREVKQMQGEERCSVSLVLDASGSMDSGNKMGQAKAAAKSFLSQVNFAGGDQVEVVSFSDYVYLDQDFTSDQALLSNAIDRISLYNMTALYDALYAALVQTYAQDGARCVIAFTDGLENGSNYTFDDVAALSQSSGIPVYLVGIGSSGDYDESSLRALASRCSGAFYSASSDDLTSALAGIYSDIYRQQQEYYIFRYTSANQDRDAVDRLLELSFSDTAAYTGMDSHDYQTQTVINGGFGTDFRNQDYMILDSSYRSISEAELAGMSLAQLRIARNEIYARHGRQFKDAMLNQWFYSKGWYLSIYPKYAPAYYDQNVNDLSTTERQNVGVIRDYENYLMASRDIYPNAGIMELTDYDLALSKNVLSTALQQMRGYPWTATLETNIQRVEDAINRADIQY